MKSQTRSNVTPLKVVGPTDSFNTAKWLLVALLLTAGVVANYYYSAQVLWGWRLLAWGLGLLIVSAIGLKTQQGRKFIAFVADSRTELRKITWPTRDETLKTTLMICIVVVIISLLLWGIDGIVMVTVGWLTGQRG